MVKAVRLAGQKHQQEGTGVFLTKIKGSPSPHSASDVTCFLNLPAPFPRALN